MATSALTMERAERGLTDLTAAARYALGDTLLDGLRDAVRTGQAASRLAPMILLRDEIPHAASAFA